MQNSLHHTQCFCFLLFSVLCSTALSPQDVVCSPFLNQKFSCSKYKKTCHDIFHVQNSLTSVNFSFSKPIAKNTHVPKVHLDTPFNPFMAIHTVVVIVLLVRRRISPKDCFTVQTSCKGCTLRFIAGDQIALRGL